MSNRPPFTRASYTPVTFKDYNKLENLLTDENISLKDWFMKKANGKVPMDKRSVLKYLLIKTELREKMEENEWFQKVNDLLKDPCVTHIYLRLIQEAIWKEFDSIHNSMTTIEQIV